MFGGLPSNIVWDVEAPASLLLRFDCTWVRDIILSPDCYLLIGRRIRIVRLAYS